MFLSSTLLSQVLVRLDNLLSIWIESSPLDTTQLVARMKSTGVIRELAHPASLISEITAGKHPFSKLVLPNLRAMRLTGDPSIGALIYRRPLKELDLNFFMQGSQFADFIEGVEGTALQDTLETLCLKLGRLVDVDLAFPILAQALPAIKRLSIEQTSMEFEVSNTVRRVYVGVRASTSATGFTRTPRTQQRSVP